MLCVNGTFVNTTYLMSYQDARKSLRSLAQECRSQTTFQTAIGYLVTTYRWHSGNRLLPFFRYQFLRWRNALQAGLSSHEFRGGAGGQISAGQKRPFYPRRGSHRGNQSQNVFCVNRRLMPQGPGVMMAPKVPKWQFIGDALSATSVGDKITELWINNPKDFL